MRPERRNFFQFIARNIGEVLKEHLSSFRTQFPDDIISSVQKKIRFFPVTASILWSDQEIPDNYKFGLKLADRFARKVFQSFNNQESNFCTMLHSAGFENVCEDITKVIARPLSRDLIEKWQMETGLPEPRDYKRLIG